MRRLKRLWCGVIGHRVAPMWGSGGGWLAGAQEGQWQGWLWCPRCHEIHCVPKEIAEMIRSLNDADDPSHWPLPAAPPSLKIPENAWL
jgi:hypothetical protein